MAILARRMSLGLADDLARGSDAGQEATGTAASTDPAKPVVKPGRQDPTAGSATHDPEAVAARCSLPPPITPCLGIASTRHVMITTFQPHSHDNCIHLSSCRPSCCSFFGRQYCFCQLPLQRQRPGCEWRVSLTWKLLIVHDLVICLAQSMRS